MFRGIFKMSQAPVGRAAFTTTTSTTKRSLPSVVETRSELEQLMRDKNHNKEGSSLLLLDVRTPDECRAGMIPGAKNIPLDEVPRAFGISLPGVESETLDPQEFQDCYDFQRPDASDPEHRIEAIVVYCRSGYRSGIAQKMLAKQYSIPVINYVGSWLDWSSQQ